MKAGFKTGPNTIAEGQKIVIEDGASFCEVWFRIDKADEYNDMLAWLQKQNVAVGLHHWGLIDGKFKTNIASSNTSIREQTIQQIKDTITIGADIGCVYVNAHSGAQATETISFNPMTQALLVEDRASKELSEKLFLQSAEELFAFAKQKNVLLTIETLPALEPTDSRLHTYDAGNMDYQTLLTMKEFGGYLANDITHTACQMFMKKTNQETVWQTLLDFTKEAASFTRLLHVNTLIPPFGGVDSHDGILEEDFKHGVFPNMEQIKRWLSLFENRPDVYVVPEPKTNMPENYRILRELVEQIP